MDTQTHKFHVAKHVTSEVSDKDPKITVVFKGKIDDALAEIKLVTTEESIKDVYPLNEDFNVAIGFHKIQAELMPRKEEEENKLDETLV